MTRTLSADFSLLRLASHWCWYLCRFTTACLDSQHVALTANLILIVAIMSVLSATLTAIATAWLVLTNGRSGRERFTFRDGEELKEKSPQQAYGQDLTSFVDHY